MDNEKMSFTLTGEAAQVVFRHSEGQRKRGEFVSRALLEWQESQTRRDDLGIMESIGAGVRRIEKRLGDSA